MTFENQIQKLMDRGLEIKNIEVAEKKLQKINYYRLSVYWKRFLNDSGKFQENSKFSEIIDLYEFDKNLKVLFMKYIEDIEIAFRSHISYQLAHKYGKYAYLESNNFSDGSHYEKFKNKLDGEIERSKSQETFIKHHMEEYNDPMPIWKSVEVLSFSTLSMLYKNLMREDKEEIAKKFYKISKNPAIDQWLHTLTVVRNISAHHGRLWNKEIKPPVRRTDAKIWKTLPNGKNDSFYAVLIVFKYLLEKEKFIQLIEELQNLLETKKNLEFLEKDLGLPEDWGKILTK